MFTKLLERRDVGRLMTDLTKDNWEGIAQSGLILGVMKFSMIIDEDIWIESNYKKGVETSFQYYYWNDLQSFIDEELENLLIVREIDRWKWRAKVLEFSNNKRASFCYGLALLLERHMRNCANSHVITQSIVIKELEKVLSGDYEPRSSIDGNLDQKDKVDFYLTIHAGSSPLIQLNFTNAMIGNHFNQIDTLVHFSIFNALKKALAELEEPYRTLLEDLIFNEHLTWKKSFPTAIGIPNWKWLPVFVKE